MMLLQPPTIASAQEKGMILDVAALGRHDPLGADIPYLRLTDGWMFQLPEELREWARVVIGGNWHAGAAGYPSHFPCRIEFGVRDGRVYAQMLERA
ncbi:hypothetical protein ACQP1O_22970 [Nocardia sp. CA-151230]|uniref:hypothetical protein n=1 Tax=Nocardia sp. CA-151230 TaxID=3239982 RepID=UPI003D92B6E1